MSSKVRSEGPFARVKREMELDYKTTDGGGNGEERGSVA